jgi:phage gpG-like protein
LLTFEFEINGAKRELSVLAAKMAELGPVMKAFSAYMRSEVQQVFDSEGGGQWAPRKESSQQAYSRSIEGRITRVEQSKYRGLGSRLQAEKRRAIKTAAKPAKTEKQAERRERAIARKEAQIAEVQRLSAGGALQPKGQAGLYKRVERRIVQAEKKIRDIQEGKALGRIAYSCTVEYDAKNWSMRSVIPWAGVHNKGGRAGRGSVIPKRTFLEWTNERVDKFAELSLDYLVGRAAKRSQSA